MNNAGPTLLSDLLFLWLIEMGFPRWFKFHEPFIEEGLFVLWEDLDPFSPGAFSFTSLVIIFDNILSFFLFSLWNSI